MQTIIFAFSLVPTLVIMIICAISFTHRFEPFVRAALSYDADLFANRIESYINQQFIQMSQITDQETTRGLLASVRDADGYPIDRELHGNLMTQLNFHRDSHPEIKALYIEDDKRNILAYIDPLYPARKSTMFDIGTSSEGLPTFRTSGLVSAPAEHPQDIYIVLSTPVVGTRGHEGTIVAMIDLGKLRSSVLEAGMFESTFRIVFDDDGAIVAISDGNQSYWSLQDLESRTDLSEHIRRDEHSGQVRFTLDGMQHTARYRYIDDLGWTVLTGIPNTEFIRPILDVLPPFFIFCTIFIIVLVLAIQHFSSLVGIPLQALIDGMEHVRKHDYRYHIPAEDHQVLGSIIQAFNSLMDHIASDTAELKRLNLELDELTTNIPGGLFTCRMEGDYPFILASEPFARLAGFPDRDALVTQTTNTFIRTVHPADRAHVAQVIKVASRSASEGTVEYRTGQGDRQRWVSCSFRIIGNQTSEPSFTLYGMAVDVTLAHEAYEQLRTSDERYRIILEQTDEVIFEWSAEQQRFLFTSREKNWVRMFGEPFPDDANLMEANFFDMHPQDRIRFTAKLKELVSLGIKSTRIEVRLTRSDEHGHSLFWTRFLLTSIFNVQGKVERLAGRIQDIHEEKVESLRLIGLSQTDSLTTLMNRRGFQASVSRILDIASGALNRHVLVMLDADDFKLINDTYGHMHGDQVLSRIAEHMRRTFRITDLFGRLGGDEFAAFLVNFQDEGVIRKKIEELLARLREDGLSCSMGIAMFPEHGSTFQQLYQSADIALYQVKNSGKNGFAIAVSDPQ